MAFINSLFHATSFRSAGFLITPLIDLHQATIFMLMIIRFVGASPASTGSGVKISTIVVFLASIRAAIFDRPDVEVKGRKIPKDQASKAVAIVSLSLLWILGTTFFLLISEQGWGIAELLFESTMAFTNVGISTGVTPTLSLFGKILIIASMIIGRIGSLTLILAITFRKHKKIVEFSYPEERIMLG